MGTQCSKPYRRDRRDMTYWLLAYLADMLFWIWVTRWGGAEKLEGTFASGFLISIFAAGWSARGIRVFGYGTMVVSTIFFILGLFSPGFRWFP
jgi:hypothetical protein